MPTERLVAQQLSAMLKVLGHPDRVLIVQLLAERGEHNVGNIAQTLKLPAVRISQHLGTLRRHQLVSETAKGRERLYTLVSGDLTRWLMDGLRHVGTHGGAVESVSDTAEATSEQHTR